MCDIFSESVDSNITFKDLKGQGTERAFLYLKKIAGLDFSGMGKELPYIKNVNAIRNLIVHNGSKLPDTPNPKVLKFLSGNPHLHGEAGGAIIIRSEFIDELLENLMQFFEKLGKEVEKYIREYDA